MTAEDLGQRYGKLLAFRKDDTLIYVVEVDEYGVEKAQWSSGLDEEDALQAAESVLALFGLPIEGMRHDAFLEIARTLPTDVLRQALSEREKKR